MSEPQKILTLELILAHWENIHALKLGTFDGIEDRAVEPLSKLKKYLNLSGLKSLPDSTAEALAKHEGILDLSGLSELSEASAALLAGMRGSLWLNGLTSVSDAVAEALSKHEGDLYLRGLTELSPFADKVLSKYGVFIDRFLIQSTLEKKLTSQQKPLCPTTTANTAAQKPPASPA